MGFWSGLGKVLGFAAPLVAAPFTGGASLLGELGMGTDAAAATAAGIGGAGNILSRIGQATGPAASSIAGGLASGRSQENINKQKAFEDALAGVNSNEANLENRTKLNEGFQNNAYQNAMRSAFAKNMKDVTISGGSPRVPILNFSGGLRPSAMGPEGRLAADTMNRQAQLQLMNGTGLPNVASTPATPNFTNAGTLENTLGITGAIGNAINGSNAAANQDSYQKSLLAKIQQIIGGNKNQNLPAVGTVNGAIDTSGIGGQPSDNQDEGLG